MVYVAIVRIGVIGFMDCHEAIMAKVEKFIQLDQLLYSPIIKYTIICYFINIKKYDQTHEILTYWSTRLGQDFVEDEHNKLTVIDPILLSVTNLSVDL